MKSRLVEPLNFQISTKAGTRPRSIPYPLTLRRITYFHPEKIDEIDGRDIFHASMQYSPYTDDPESSIYAVAHKSGCSADFCVGDRAIYNHAGSGERYEVEVEVEGIFVDGTLMLKSIVPAGKGQIFTRITPLHGDELTKLEY